MLKDDYSYVEIMSNFDVSVTGVAKYV